MPSQSSARFATTAKWLAWLLAIGFLALFVFSAILRLAYPYEVEWMEGSMIDHAIRALHGMPIYVAPSIRFVPWLYPPLYYKLVALVMSWTGMGFFAGRIVSVVSTLGTAVLLGHLAKRKTGEWSLGFFAFALYIAAYHVTGYYYDIARVDALFVFLVTLLVYVSAISKWEPDILAVVAIGLAFLTKQQALCYLPAVGLWFFLRSTRRGWAFSLGTVALASLQVWSATTLTHGWYAYYVLDVPSAKSATFSWMNALLVLPHYVLGAFAVSTIAIIFWLILRGRERQFWSDVKGLLVLAWLASLIVGALSLGNAGGYRNVMMPFAAFSAVLLPIAASDLASIVPVRGFIPLILVLQLIAFGFNPLGEKMLFASEHQRQGAETFVQTVANLPGEVYIPYHGFIGSFAGKSSHANLLATLDVLRMNDSTAHQLRAEFDVAFAEHRFGAVIMDQSSALPFDSVRHYRYAGEIVREPNVNLSRFGDDATRPNYLWLPDSTK